MGHLVLVLGGQKSGKSTLAGRIAREAGRPVVVIAPAEARDVEFVERVARHRADRPPEWRTIETFDLPAGLAKAGAEAAVVIDALDSWLAGAMDAEGLWTGADVEPLGPEGRMRVDAILDRVDELADAVRGRDGTTIVVAGQPGLGAHAMGAAARRYVDLHGLLLQRLAAVADRVLLAVAGRALDVPAGDASETHVPTSPRSAVAARVPRRDLPAYRSGIADLAGLMEGVRPVDDDAREAAWSRLGRLAAPPASLGALEGVAAQLAAVAGSCPPPIPGSPTLVVAAGDHGVHAEGVSAWPQSVTHAMASVVAAGDAVCNAIAATVGARVVLLDAGMADRVPRSQGGGASGGAEVVARPVAAGTRNLAVEAAMSMDGATAAILAGARTANAAIEDGSDLLVTGDLGIANTTASACLVAALTGASAADVAGGGAGGDEALLDRKRAVIDRALARHRNRRRQRPEAAKPSDRRERAQADDSTRSEATTGCEPLEVLASLGGHEHAALVGIILGAAQRRVPVVLDGLIANAAALVAVGLAPAVSGYLLAGHRSREPGAAIALDRLGARPLLDLDMALGEGTGALLAVPVVQAAARVLHDVAVIDDVLKG